MQDEVNTFTEEPVSAGGAVFRLINAQTVQEVGAEKRKISRQEAAEFSELVQSLLALLRTSYPPHLIAVIAGWGLRTTVGSQGVGHESMIKGVSQHHAELLQATALTLSAAEWGQKPAEMEDIQKTIDIILKLAKAFVATRMVAAEAITDPLSITKQALQERLRLHTQMVRNWGPYRLILQILRDLYEPLNARINDRHGFGALDVITVAEHLVAGVEAQGNQQFRLLKDIFKARTIPDLVHDFFRRFPGVAGDPAELLSILGPRESLESVRARLLAHADRWMVVNSIAPVASIAITSGLSEAKTRAILDYLSLSLGDLSGKDFSHLFLDNPVWTKPGIKYGDQYFFAFPQAAVSFLHQILQKLSKEAGLKIPLEQRRSIFLEQETFRLVSQALPGAIVQPEAKWTWQGVTYETDVLAVLDRSVLIVECKSAALTPQGLRGAPERVRRHVVDLIVDSAIQSARLEGIITQARDGDPEALAVTVSLGLNPADVDEIIRVSVTLDDLTVLASAERDLKAAGWFPAELESAPTLNIADLACIADILTRPAQFLHYFSRRAQMQRAADVAGLEMDFLGLYLATSFNLPTVDGRYDLIIPAMSREIDLYYQNIEIGHPSEKPVPRLEPFFNALLDQLETHRPEGWITIALELLSIGHDGQVACVEALETLRLNVSQGSAKPDQVNMMIVTPDDQSDFIVVLYVSCKASYEKKDEVVRKLAEHALVESGRTQCLFISRMVETWDTNPYEVIGLAWG